jgi:tRNA threonylcarbamoyladenosine biosynthesis protein TsaE
MPSRHESQVTLVTDSEARTRLLAATFSSLLEPADVVGLRGDLGTGKTVFVSAIATALEVPKEAGVRSPSYTLMNIYEGGTYPIAHLDLYRVDDVDELEALGFRDLLDEGMLVLVEWPERVPDLERDVTWWVDLRELDVETREITFRSRKSRHLEPLSECLSQSSR